ncbi:MAG: elongation factor P [Candidatus Campbellbacteria bacterium]|nr:elongation factor P [Candidatus Campbellbacteria bacterium]
MLSYNEVRERSYIVHQGEPNEVLSSKIFRKQQRKPVNQIKLKNLITGKQTETTIHQSEKVEPASIETRDIKYLYSRRGESWFCEVDDPSDRFSIPDERIEDSKPFIREDDIVTALIYEDEVVGIKLPIKVELEVREAPPNIKGNTSSGGNKSVTLETGYTVNAPLFINPGDILRINTETGEYVERVEKA